MVEAAISIHCQRSQYLQQEVLVELLLASHKISFVQTESGVGLLYTDIIANFYRTFNVRYINNMTIDKSYAICEFVESLISPVLHHNQSIMNYC